MMKRVTWFVSGAVAGAVGVTAVKKKVKTKVKSAAAELAPANLARKAADYAREAAVDAKRVLKTKELELRARWSGDPAQGATLAEELNEGDEVFVDGKPVEPGQVVVLRHVRERNEAAGRRRQQA